MERKLELYEYTGNLAYGLFGWHTEGHLCKIDVKFVKNNGLRLGNYKPILRPLSDLCKPIIHNGKKEVSIVELAKIAFPELLWEFNHSRAWSGTSAHELVYNGIEKAFVAWKLGFKISVPNQYQLFDYLHSRFIDYRGLIDAGLAISVYDLEQNPYV